MWCFKLFSGSDCLQVWVVFYMYGSRLFAGSSCLQVWVVSVVQVVSTRLFFDRGGFSVV